jgi:hypothetical protein
VSDFTESFFLKSVAEREAAPMVKKSSKYSESKRKRIRALYGIRATIPFSKEAHATCNGHKFERKSTFARKKTQAMKSKRQGSMTMDGQMEVELVEMPKPFLKRLIISPDAKWKSVFDIWVLLFVGYSCIWNILVFAFPFTASKKLDYFNLLIEFVFQLDFFLTFFQSFKHPETYEVIDDYKLIAINYFWGWFWIDLISIFPFALFLGNSGA